MALDEPNENDDVVESGGFSFVIDKELQKQTGDIRVDMTYYGFVVDSANPVTGGGGSCDCSSGGCGSGGCGS